MVANLGNIDGLLSKSQVRTKVKIFYRYTVANVHPYTIPSRFQTDRKKSKRMSDSYTCLPPITRRESMMLNTTQHPIQFVLKTRRRFSCLNLMVNSCSMQVFNLLYTWKRKDYWSLWYLKPLQNYARHWPHFASNTKYSCSDLHKIIPELKKSSRQQLLSLNYSRIHTLLLCRSSAH